MATPIPQYNEFTPQIQGLERQRKMAQILMQQGMQQPQGQMVSGHYVAPSWTQHLAGLGNIAAGLYSESQADKRALDLAKELRGKQQEAVQEYFSALQPSAPTERVYASNVGPAIEMVEGKPDYQKAFRAATSDFAPSWLTGMAVKQLEPVKLGEGEQIMQRNFATGELTPMAGGGVKLAGKVKEAAQLLGINKPYDQWTPQELNAVNAKVEDLTSRGASRQIVHLPPAESEYAKTFGAGLAKQDLTLKDIAENAPQTIANVQRQRKLLDSGQVMTGFGAEQRLDLARVGSALGVGGKNSQEIVANTQQLMAGRAGATLDAIKSSGLGSGQGFTNKDREFLEAAKLGGIKYDKTALQRQLDLEEKVARLGAQNWNQRLKTMPKSTAPVNPQPIVLPPAIGDVDANNPLLK